MTLTDLLAAPAADREIVITREYDAPARLLFTAWSTPEHLRRWFGPKGWPLTLCEVDFRVGGTWRFAMTGSTGVQNTPFGGEYLEIEPNRKIVFSNTFEKPGAETLLVTVTFDERDGRTTVTIHTLFSSVAVKEWHEAQGYAAGYNSALDQLTDVVAELPQ
jgi:uncharacterized protein YndB with AHSA1/START domain